VTGERNGIGVMMHQVTFSELAVDSQYLNQRCVFKSPKCDNYVSQLSSAHTHWGSFSAPSDPLPAIRGGLLLLRARRKRERRGKGEKS